MQFQRSLFAAVLAVSALGAASVAQARSDVSWSIGIGVPGVQVYGAPQPVYVQPAPVYYQPPPQVVYRPAPVYVRPEPVYYQQPQPVVYQRPPVYVQPQVVYAPPRWGHHKHHRDWDEGRGNDWRR
ncbi:hypothetical protein [Rhodoferax sp. WC2427]|uniref:hypothetical protein n=1 Tax=Rhodoferax sp. WC2427 TaxID=3234144 RepID=UPI00346709CE